MSSVARNTQTNRRGNGRTFTHTPNTKQDPSVFQYKGCEVDRHGITARGCIADVYFGARRPEGVWRGRCMWSWTDFNKVNPQISQLYQPGNATEPTVQCRRNEQNQNNVDQQARRITVYCVN